MKSIAVIGSGIAGLSAAWLLSKQYRVTLYEAEARLGGHSHSVDVTLDDHTAPVDTGFLVCNDRTYPNLLKLFKALDIGLCASDMSFSVQVAAEKLEWSGTSLATVFGDKRNLLRPEFWRMTRDVLRFNREALLLLNDPALTHMSVGEFLTRYHYSRAFRDWYLLPMAAAIWSCPTHQMLDFPAQSFIRFFDQHGLLQLSNRPQWLTVRGGSRRYVERMATDIGEVLLNQPVQQVARFPDRVEITSQQGRRRFDHVVMACHSDQALALLTDANDTERAILNAVQYQPNRAVLHTDSRILPRRRALWSAWNFHAAEATPDNQPVSVTYLINQLQPLPFDTPVMVTLNPDTPIQPDKIIAAFDYAHPVFDRAAITAQTRLTAIQGQRHTWFCGAWTGYGFHEDGLKSGMAVAQGLGVTVPWLEREIA
jgi:predicted NAD/FAD-binding protein